MSTRAVGVVIAICLVVGTARATEVSFWVWNRARPLTKAEVSALRKGEVKRLYWQVGELELRPEGSLFLHRTASEMTEKLNPAPDQLEVVPVVRLSTEIRSPENFTGEALGQALKPVVDASRDRTVQVDFDCPDRALSIYAERLRTARQVAGIHHLLITALDHWSDVPARAELWKSVDEVFPMLYDVEKDPVPDAADLAAWAPRPVLDLGRLRARLASWRQCPIPWHAGLPAFARVTLYDATAHSLGHLRSWSWEDLVFNSNLRQVRPPQAGITLLRAVAATRLEGSAVATGGFVAARWPDRADLCTAMTLAEAAGARSVVLFRLPDPSENDGNTTGLDPEAAGGWSLSQLTSLTNSTSSAGAVLQLTHATDGSERLVLHNDSEVDLPPRFGDADGHGRGYSLEIETPAGAAWREALAGDFHRVTGYRFASGGKEGDAKVVAIPLATRLTFWFSHLPAHTALGTGLLQLAPGIDPASLRYRVDAQADLPNTAWQPIR